MTKQQRDIAGMRDKLIHDYFNIEIVIDAEIIWKTIQEDIPQVSTMDADPNQR